MTKFKEDYGVPLIVDGKATVDITSAQRSVVTSIVQAGEFCGALLAGPFGDWYGRRGAFFGAIFFLCLGTILQLIVAGNLPLLGTGRALVGVGVGFLANSTPLYLSEISTAAIRGAVVGSWQLLLAIGQVIGACVGQGTHNLTTTAAYRIPIGLNLFLALVLFVAQFIIPESPRWLVSKGRDEEAKKSLYKINKDQADPDIVVEMQYQSFQEAHQEEMEMGKTGWMSLLHGVEARKLLIVCGTLTAQQIGGVQFIFSYTTTFFSASGIADPFLVTIIVDIIEVVGVLCSFLVVNRFGRRPLLIYTSIPMAASLFVAGGLGRNANGLPVTTAENRALVAMICIYVFFFNLAWGPLAWVIASECAVGQNRQKLMSLGSATFFVWAFVVAFTLPYLFDPEEANLGSQIGFIYGPLTCVSLLFVYFCVPETRGRTLEGSHIDNASFLCTEIIMLIRILLILYSTEINEMINAKVPTRKWTTHISSLQRYDGGLKQNDSQIESPSSDGHAEVDDKDNVDKFKSGAVQSNMHDADAMERQ